MPLFIGIGVVVIIGIIIVVVAILISNNNKIETSSDLVELQGVIIDYKESVEYFDNLFDQSFRGEYIAYAPNSSTKWYDEELNELLDNYSKIKEFREKLDHFADIKAIDSAGKKVAVDDTLKVLRRTLDKRNSFNDAYKEINTSILNIYKNNGSENDISSLKSYSENKYFQGFVKDLEKYFENKKTIGAEYRSNNCDSTKTSETCSAINKKLTKMSKNLRNNEWLPKAFSEISNEYRTENSPVVLMNRILDMNIVIEDEA